MKYIYFKVNLRKCLEELETEHGTTQHLADNYEKVEMERNQLLDELDVAFQDLQEYMGRQVHFNTLSIFVFN